MLPLINTKKRKLFKCLVYPDTMISSNKSIETGADRLINLVKERSPITLTQASEILNLEKKTVEDWAKVLEDAEIIIIKDNLRDKVLMRPEYDENASETLTRHVQSLFSSTVSTRERTLKKQQEYVEKQMLELDKKLEQLKHYNNIKTITECELNKLNKRKIEIEKMQLKLDKSLNDIQKNTYELRLKEQEIQNREEQLKKDSKELLIRSESLKTQKNALAEREKKVYEHISDIILTHDKSKSKLISHLEKIKR